MNTAYVYKWTHIPTYKWYIGSRTSKNAHPDDGYLCSSKTVKPMILEHPEEWKREILFIGNQKDAYEYETMLLDMFDAKHDERSFNKHNNDGKCNFYGRHHTEESKIKISEKSKTVKANLGRVWDESYRKKMSEILTGRKLSEEWKFNISESRKGKPRPVLKCPHCGKEGGDGNMHRWHFDNCKSKQ